jgi:hypothetical protein
MDPPKKSEYEYADWGSKHYQLPTLRVLLIGRKISMMFSVSFPFSLEGSGG